MKFTILTSITLWVLISAAPHPSNALVRRQAPAVAMASPAPAVTTLAAVPPAPFTSASQPATTVSGQAGYEKSGSKGAGSCGTLEDPKTLTVAIVSTSHISVGFNT
ncbi:hypothetical protein H4R33_006477 [Dimargaris cristalligena]|nr:hypothetical protein H4R33_006477 [Dimargaris cristalligena]